MHKKASTPTNSRPKFKANTPSQLILLHKPFQVMCQFTREGERLSLADTLLEHAEGRRIPRDVYPAGRLDYDSEGLVVLTNVGTWQARISNPKHHWVKTYWAQVEGEITHEQTQALVQGVTLNDGPARAVAASELVAAPAWPRHPPIRYRAQIPTSWLSLSLNEGRNRQVRRMTAAVGLPTLRLIRWQVGPWSLEGLAPGQWRSIDASEAIVLLGPPN